MQANQITPFLDDAYTLLAKATDKQPERGSPLLRSGRTDSSRELTAIVGVRGALGGALFCSMSLATAAKLAGVLGEAIKELTGHPEEQAIAYLATQVSTTGVEGLAALGEECEIDEPVVVRGFGEPLTAISPVLIVPLFTTCGDIDLGLALRPGEEITEDTPVVIPRREPRVIGEDPELETDSAEEAA